MRRVLTILLSTMVLALQARLHMPADTLHMGSMYDTDDDRTLTVSLHNMEADTVAILGIRPSCACIEATVSEKVIAPGDSTMLTVAYSPRGANGRIVKTLTINTSEGKMVVPVTATVGMSETSLARKFPIVVGSLRLSRGELPVEPHSTKFLRAFNGYDCEVEIRADNAPSWARPKVLKPLSKPGDQTIITVEFTNETAITDSQVTVVVIDAATKETIDNFSISLITNP